jgi:hypothetical protein
MKSLKEFIAENLENANATSVRENTEKSDNNQDEANENNENILNGQTNIEKTD